MKSKMFIIFLLLIILFGCTTVNLKEYKVSGEKLLYPAIFYAFMNGNPYYWESAFLNKITLYKNEFDFNNLYVRDGLVPSIFNLKLSIKDGIVTYDYYDIYQSIDDIKWEKMNRFFIFNPVLISDYLNTNIEKVMNDANLYEQSRKQALSDLIFLVKALENMTEITRKDFIQKELTGIKPEFKVELSDIKENDKKEFPDYKYKIRASRVIPKRKYSTGLADYVFLTLYTNREDITTYSKEDAITISGTVIDIGVNTIGNSLIMTD